jgi:hypothetical protein
MEGTYATAANSLDITPETVFLEGRPMLKMATVTQVFLWLKLSVH